MHPSTTSTTCDWEMEEALSRQMRATRLRREEEDSLALARQLQREEDSRIRGDQEREYLESLAVDRRRKEEKDRKARETFEKEEAVRRAKEEREECRRIFEEKREEIKDLHCGENLVDTDTVKILIRFPSGEKAERVFYLEDSIESLFNAALSHPACPPLFSLNLSYPRRKLSIVPKWYGEWRQRAYPEEEFDAVDEKKCSKTFSQEGLKQSAVIMLQNEDS